MLLCLESVTKQNVRVHNSSAWWQHRANYPLTVVQHSSDAGPLSMPFHFQASISNVFKLLVDDSAGKEIEFLVAATVEDFVTRSPPGGVSGGPEMSDPDLLLIFMSRVFLFITQHT